MDSGDQGGTVVAKGTSGPYGDVDDGDQGGTVVAQRTSGPYGEVGDGDQGGMDEGGESTHYMSSEVRLAI